MRWDGRGEERRGGGGWLVVDAGVEEEEEKLSKAEEGVVELRKRKKKGRKKRAFGFSLSSSFPFFAVAQFSRLAALKVERRNISLSFSFPVFKK